MSTRIGVMMFVIAMITAGLGGYLVRGLQDGSQPAGRTNGQVEPPLFVPHPTPTPMG